MENPLISIIIPAYNAVNYIQETIESCLNQTYNRIEIIVQDDRSNDGTWELLNQLYKNNLKVRLFRNEKNLGIGDNWNAAYDKVTGDYVIIFNADDLISPDLITVFLNRFNSDSSIDIVTGKFDILISETGQTSLYPDHVGMQGGIVKDLFKKFYFKSSFHWNYSLVKRSLLEKVKENNKLFKNTQICDVELWYRCYLANAVIYFEDTKIWGYYRKHQTNNSSKPNGELNSFLKDFLRFHGKSFRKNAGLKYPLHLTRNLITFCNFYKRRKSFDIKIFFLYIKRIIQGLI